jgi:hypothetical protein
LETWSTAGAGCLRPAKGWTGGSRTGRNLESGAGRSRPLCSTSAGTSGRGTGAGRAARGPVPPARGVTRPDAVDPKTEPRGRTATASHGQMPSTRRLDPEAELPRRHTARCRRPEYWAPRPNCHGVTRPDAVDPNTGPRGRTAAASHGQMLDPDSERTASLHTKPVSLTLSKNTYEARQPDAGGTRPPASIFSFQVAASSATLNPFPPA